MNVPQNVRTTVHEGLSCRSPILLREGFAFALIFLLLVVALQVAAGAYSLEFSGDAAAHYVTGLWLRDFAQGGLDAWLSPMAFLRNYHSHFPVIGIGHWPPVFYVIESGWMLVAGTGRTATVLFSALGTATLALCAFLVATRHFGRGLGLMMAIALLVSSLVRVESNQLMLDIAVALACFVSAWFYGRYMNTPTMANGLAFGLLTSLAILTKGNAFCLAFLPPFAVLMGRRYDLLRRASFWAPLAVVGVLLGPWTYFTYGMVAVGFRFPWGWEYTSMAFMVNADILFKALGLGLSCASLIGLAATAYSRRSADPESTQRIAFAALAASVFAFQALVPSAIQDRYMLPALAPLLILALFGFQTVGVFVADRMANGGATPRLVSLLGGSFLVLFIAFQIDAAMQTELKPIGLKKLIQNYNAVRAEQNPVLLLALGADQEAAAVAEVALQDSSRPFSYALRGSRLLGGGGYNSHEYLVKFKSAAEVMLEIDRYKIPYVLVKTRPKPKDWGHVRQVNDAVLLFPNRWQEVITDTEGDKGIALYRVVGNSDLVGNLNGVAQLSAPNLLK